IGYLYRIGYFILFFSLFFLIFCRPELLENVDFPGTDIKFVYSPDVNHCQQLCTQHPSCLFFTFVRADWTKDNRLPQVQIPLLGLTSGYSLKPCQTNSRKNHQNDHYWLTVAHEGLDLNGSDMRFVVLDDAESCRRACNDDSNCQFYTYVTENFSDSAYRYCHLILHI
uniref:Apple domain-containing protein n=1 Tax=Neogobius melanostomus TaxID=47308 RepID=A0A8C6WP47_9GOBI